MSTAARRSAVISRAADRPSRPGILMSRMATSGSSALTSVDGLVAPAGLAHDLVALLLEGLLEVEADDGLVLGDDDAGRHSGRTFRGWSVGADRTDPGHRGDAASGRRHRRRVSSTARRGGGRAARPGCSRAGRSRPRPRRGATASRRRGSGPRGAPARRAASRTTSARSRASSASSAKCASCSSATARSRRSALSCSATSVRRRSTTDRDMAEVYEPPGTARIGAARHAGR